MKLKVVARCGDSKLLVYAIQSYLGVEYLNTRNYTLEGCECFWFTKWKLDQSPGADCDSHQSNKVKYSIPHPITCRAIRACIEESLNFREHIVAHTASVLEINYIASQWHIISLSPNLAKRYWIMQASTCFSCNAKINIKKAWHSCLNL